jgi:hypothetical protein
VVAFNLIGNPSFEEVVKAVLKLTTDTSVNGEILLSCLASKLIVQYLVQISMFIYTLNSSLTRKGEAPSINQVYVELLEPTNTTKIAAYVAVAKKVSEIFVRTPTTRKNPNRVTATATVTRLLVLSLLKLIIIVGTRMHTLLANETIVPARMVIVREGYLGPTPDTP